MYKMIYPSFFVILALHSVVLPVDEGLDQKDIDNAIEGGCKFLRAKVITDPSEKSTDELVLLTLVHAGYDGGDKIVRFLLKRILSKPLERTYNVSLLASALSRIDPVKYQKYLIECAEFLVYNQCENGQWSYGERVPKKGFISTRRSDEPASGAIATGTESETEEDNLKKVYVEVKDEDKLSRKKGGDNSNTHYAVLGIKACADAGIVFPETTTKKALDWWYDAQWTDGGWSYRGGDKDDSTDVRGDGGGRKKRGGLDGEPYGSMTCAGVSSLSTLLWLRGKNWKEDQAVLDGMKWLHDNFTVKVNPSAINQRHHYYYIYAVERAGVIYGTDKFIDTDWYDIGARFLLKEQQRDGSWFREETLKVHKITHAQKSILETCFAVLFLKRATKPLGEFIQTGISEEVDQ